MGFPEYHFFICPVLKKKVTVASRLVQDHRNIEDNFLPENKILSKRTHQSASSLGHRQYLLMTNHHETPNCKHPLFLYTMALLAKQHQA